MDEKKVAVEILELARKHVEERGYWGSILRAFDEAGIPWTTGNVSWIANDAIDQAIVKWRGRAPGAFRDLPGLFEAAQREGRDILGDAIRYVTRCERCEEPGKPISITDNVGDLGKVTMYLCDSCEGLRRASDPSLCAGSRIA
jgi:hypothetical protein